MKITKLKKAEYNPRKISDENLARLTESLKEFGLVQPIVVNKRNNVIVGGHQRLKAWEALGNKELNDDQIHWVDLDESDEKRLNLKLNNTGGENDYTMLAELDRDLFFGIFEDHYIDALFDAPELDIVEKPLYQDTVKMNEQRTCPNCNHPL